MASGCGYLKSALSRLLTYNILEIRDLGDCLRFSLSHFRASSGGQIFPAAGRAGKNREHLLEVFHAIDLYSGELYSFKGRVERQDYCFKPKVPCHRSIGQGSVHTPYTPVQGQFSHNQKVLQSAGFKLARSHQHTNGYRQVIAAAALAKVCGSQVDDK